MAKVAGDVVMRIGGDNSGFTRVLSDSSSKLDAFRSNINSGAKSLAKFSAAAGVAGAALAVAITRDAAQAGKEISNLARVSGTTTTEFQRMAAAAQAVGVDSEKLGDSFKDMRDRVGDFIISGGGPMVDFFERIAPKIGMTAEQFRDLSGPDALQAMVNGMEQAGLSGNEMAAAMEMVISDGTKLLPLFQNGGESLKQFGDEAQRAGRILSDIDVARLQLAAQQMAEFDQTIGTLKNQLGAELAPILAGIGKLIEDAAKEAGGFGNLVGDSMNTAIDAAGFVLDAIAGIKRSFEVAGKGIALFALGGKAALLNLSDIIINGPIKAINELIEGFNSVPMLPDIEPIGASELGKEIEQSLAETRQAIIVAQQDIHDTLMEPLPSDNLKKWVSDVQGAADEAAMSMNERLAESMGGQGLQLFDNAETDKAASEAAEKHRQQLADRIERIRQANLTEIELQKEKYAAEQEALRQARELNLEIKGGYDNAEQEAKARHEQALSDIEQRAADATAKIEQERARSREQAISTMFSNLSSLMNSESRKMFEIGKAAAISQAIIDTISSAQASFNALAGIPIVGPALGAAAAAAAVAGGMARVQQIRSQSFGQGGSAGAAGGGGFSAPAQTPGVGIQGQQQQTQQFNISLADEGMFSGRQVRQLIGQINDQTQNNGVVLVTGG